MISIGEDIGHINMQMKEGFKLFINGRPCKLMLRSLQMPDMFGGPFEFELEFYAVPIQGEAKDEKGTGSSTTGSDGS